MRGCSGLGAALLLQLKGGAMMRKPLRAVYLNKADRSDPANLLRVFTVVFFGRWHLKIQWGWMPG
jgi:hypothetical protein